jgi:type IV pilus assembly protein PilC
MTFRPGNVRNRILDPATVGMGERNGEETGTLDQAFKWMGDYFDQEVKRTVQALLAAIDPMAIISLGALFGLIVLFI